MGNNADKYYLWIDGVGGYLLCLANQVTIGQATPDSGVDIPVFADISRHHATLTRDPEGHLLEAVRSVLVNDRQVDRALLHSGDRVTLGKSCQFLFRQPAALSASAVLELVSGHRLRVAVDAVLLMAESLVLGPGPQAHIVVPDLRKPLVLFRGKDGLGIQGARMLIGGRQCLDRGQIVPGSTVSGEDFSLGLEAVKA
jgi:FHA domain-containing protein